METLLTLLSGIGWIIVYEECIRLGFKYKTYSMPLWALGLNFAWETIYSFSDIFLNAHGPLDDTMTLVQVIANVIWTFLDIVILYTYFKHGKKEAIHPFEQKFFVPSTVLVVVCCFILQIAFILEFDFVMAAQYSAFLQNLMMSVLFIQMYFKRNSLEGQSLLLAIAKWIGTLAPTLIMGVMTFNIVVLTCGIFCSIFDLIYIYLIATHNKRN